MFMLVQMYVSLKLLYERGHAMHIVSTVLYNVLITE